MNKSDGRDAGSKPASSCSNQAQASSVLAATAAGGGVDNVDRKWAWHYKALVALRERLAKDRSEQLQTAAEPFGSHNDDLGDRGSDEFDHDLALGALCSEQDALYEMDEAIRRLLNGTYGFCQESGKPIPAGRLRAIPWTRFSKKVEERLEKEGGIRRPHLGQVASIRGLKSDLFEQPEPSNDEAEQTEAADEALPDHRAPHDHSRRPKSPGAA
jgi:RNA polymerase-binding transcription factor DksA